MYSLSKKYLDVLSNDIYQKISIMQESSIETKTDILDDVKLLVSATQNNLVEGINSNLITLYWHIGKYINEARTENDTEEYKNQLIKNLARVLMSEYGKNFTCIAITQMSRFHEIFAKNIMEMISHKLCWGHILELLALKYSAEREFYTYMTISEKWSIKQLKKNIEKMLYSSTIGFQKLEDYHKEILTPISNENSLNINIIMRDPYMLEFLGLTVDYSESVFVDNIIKFLENYILELNAGFSLIARQKRMTIKENYFWLDLVFYQRKLHRIIAFDVILDNATIGHKQQMALNLHWLKKYESNDNENSPIGVIIYIRKSGVNIELCNIDSNEIDIGDSFQKLLSIQQLTNKIQESINAV